MLRVHAHTGYVLMPANICTAIARLEPAKNSDIALHTSALLASSTLRSERQCMQVESKLFYLDLKRNARGRYLKIAEKGTNRERSTIIVPFAGIMWFRELFNYYAGGTNEAG